MLRTANTKKRHREGILSNYCGFGGQGVPQHQVDRLCEQHDNDYDIIIKSGKDPYTNYNWADEKFLKGIYEITPESKREYVLKMASNAVFRAKRVFASNDESLLNSPKPSKADPPTIQPKRKATAKLNGNPPKMRRTDDNEDVDMDQTDNSGKQVALFRSGGDSSGQSVLSNGETPITRQRPHYGMQDTTTVVLPHTMYFSAVTYDGGVPSDGQKPTEFEIRLNSPYNYFMSQIGTDPAGGAGCAPGLFRRKPSNFVPAEWTIDTYPSSAAGSGTNEVAQWRTFYEKLYDKYTQLGVEYDVTFYNPINSEAQHVAIAWGIDSYSVANGGRTFPGGRPAAEMEFWPGIHWAMVKSRADGSDDNRYAHIKGYYKPGQVDRNVDNDEDVKTWTSVGAVPTLIERLRFFLFPGAMNVGEHNIPLMVRVQMRFIVQYKQIKESVMYPAGQTAFALNIPTDIKQVQQS